MQIINETNGIRFHFAVNRDITVNRGQIININKHWDFAKAKYRILVKASNGEELKFYYEDVTSPLSGDEDALITLLLAWNAPSAVMSSFTADAGQTIFTMPSVLKTTTIAVVGGAVQTWGYAAVAGGYDVVFAAPFIGNEEVIIFSF